MLPQPQRIYDSRLNTVRGILSAGTTRTVTILGATDAAGVPLAVPAQALGIVCNLTVTQTSSFRFSQAWPEGARPSLGSNVNWAPQATVANAAILRVGSDGSLRLYVETPDAHVIIDVGGYIL